MTEAAERAVLVADPRAWPIWQALRAKLADWPGVEVRVQKSQIGLWVRRPFAAAWCPAAALNRPAAPLVVSVFARERLDGPWKELVEPAPGRWTHHAELQSAADLTPALIDALARAHKAATT